MILTPDELQELCLEARRRFYSWGSMAERLCDRQANVKNLLMLGVYLGLNLGTHFDIDRRQGLKLGAGLDDLAVGQIQQVVAAPSADRNEQLPLSCT